jgi:hypothetical protein
VTEEEQEMLIDGIVARVRRAARAELRGEQAAPRQVERWRFYCEEHSAGRARVPLVGEPDLEEPRPPRGVFWPSVPRCCEWPGCKVAPGWAVVEREAE